MRMSSAKRKEYFDSTDGKCAFCGKEMRFRGFFIDAEIDLPICPDCRKVKGDLSTEKYRERLLLANKITERMPHGRFWYEERMEQF